jgi:hypothetical protein
MPFPGTLQVLIGRLFSQPGHKRGAERLDLDTKTVLAGDKLQGLFLLE